MGTRNLTMVISQEKTKVAQYGQWDGCPEGQGATALEFLRKSDLNKFKEQVDKLSFFTEEEIKAIDSDGNWKDKYPYLSRDMGAEILKAIYDGQVEKLINKEAFAGDSLMNEWTYVIDLDKNTFEVYEGLNQKPLAETERFFSYFNHPEHRTEKYYPVKLAKTYSIAQLPTEEEFIADFTEKEEE